MESTNTTDKPVFAFVGHAASVVEREAAAMGLFSEQTATHGIEVPCIRCGELLSMDEFQEHSCLKSFVDGQHGAHSCSKCALVFSDKSVKLKHESACTEDNVVATCSVCAKSFKSMWGYRCHMKSHERSVGLTSNCHGCPECGKFFTSGSHLRRHIKNHSGDRPYVCVCGKSYKQNYDLKMHTCHLKPGYQ